MSSVMSTTEFFLDFNARRQIQPEDDGKNESWKCLTTILRKEQYNNRSYHVSGELLCEGPEGGVSQVPGIWKAGTLCLLCEPRFIREVSLCKRTDSLFFLSGIPEGSRRGNQSRYNVREARATVGSVASV